MAASAHTFVVIADDSKESTYLGEKVNCVGKIEGQPLPLSMLSIYRGFSLGSRPSVILCAA